MAYAFSLSMIASAPFRVWLMSTSLLLLSACSATLPPSPTVVMPPLPDNLQKEPLPFPQFPFPKPTSPNLAR